MNFDELGNSWREQNDKPNESDSVEVLTKVVRKAEQGRIKNIFGGIVGGVISLLVIFDFGNMILNATSWSVRIGASLCVLGALGLLPTIVWSLWPSRISGQSVCDYFSRELQRNDKLIASNKSPYMFFLLLLLTVGACVIAIGNQSTQRAILTIVLALGINAVAYWGARRFISRAEALRQDMEQLLSDLRQDPA